MSEELAKRESDEVEQMNLALEGEKLIVDYTELEFAHTGERFLRDHPERAKIAIKLIALNFSTRAICNKVHASHHTIRELRYRCIREVEKQKEELRSVVFPGVMMSADRAIELLPSIKNAKDAAITHGILRDTFVQLSGLPTVKIQVEGSISIFEQINGLANDLRENMKQARARVVEKEQLTNELSE